jgi:hypothetical protein
MLRQCRFVSTTQVRSIPEHEVWGADRHWWKPPLFAWPHSSYAVVCQGFAGDTEVSADAASHDALRPTATALPGGHWCLWITSTTTQNSELVSVGIPFMGFKELCPGVPQNLFLDIKRPRFFHLVNTRGLSLPCNILTFSQWEKTSTGVGRPSTIR